MLIFDIFLLTIFEGFLPHKLKNAVCALQITCKLLPFPLEKSCKNKQTSYSLPYLKAVSTIPNMSKYNFLT